MTDGRIEEIKERRWHVSNVSHERLENVLNSYSKNGCEIYAIIQNPRNFSEVTVVAYELEARSAPSR